MNQRTCKHCNGIHNTKRIVPGTNGKKLGWIKVDTNDECNFCKKKPVKIAETPTIERKYALPYNDN